MELSAVLTGSGFLKSGITCGCRFESSPRPPGNGSDSRRPLKCAVRLPCVTGSTGGSRAPDTRPARPDGGPGVSSSSPVSQFRAGPRGEEKVRADKRWTQNMCGSPARHELNGLPYAGGRWRSRGGGGTPPSGQTPQLHQGRLHPSWLPEGPSQVVSFPCVLPLGLSPYQRENIKGCKERGAEEACWRHRCVSDEADQFCCY